MNVTRRTFFYTAGTAVAGLSIPVVAKAGGFFNSEQRHEICCFSKHLQYCNFREMSEILARAGFDGIDLTVRPGGHVEPENAARDLPEAVKAARSAGLTIPMITTSIRNPDDELTHKVLKSASENGVKFYRMGSLKYDPSAGIEENLKTFRRLFERFEAVNKEYGIHGDYQNHWGRGFGAPIWDLYNVLKGLDPQWIGSQYDIRHAVVEGGESWMLGLKAMAPYIHSSAVKDFLWVNKDGDWRPESVPLGTGMVDFSAYFEAYKTLNNAGPISLHYEYGLGRLKDRNEENLSNEMIIEFYKKDLDELKKRLTDAGIR